MNHTRFRRRAVAIAAAGTAAVLIAAVPAVAANRDRDDASAAARKAVVGGQARSVILLLGDGMGDSEITIARNYHAGAAGRLAMDSLPLTGEYTTYSVQKSDPSKPDYVTDSAASGSAWATGYKTYNGAISVTPDGTARTTILEQAKRAGYRTGNVTTAEMQDATPAVLESHVTDRSCYGPDVTSTKCPTNAIENGGLGSISEQEVAFKADVLFGGGRQYFDQTIKGGAAKGSTVWQSAQKAGYRTVESADQLAALGTTTQPILGAFAPGNMDLEWTGPTPTAAGTAASRCATNASRSGSQPHLTDMTAKALQILDARSKKSKKGFFLQVEGASIDKQDHAANPCGQIGETVQFDKAVALALAYQRTHEDTLVVVTADHGHTSQIVETGTTTPGVTATLTTKDDAPMTISYATTAVPGSQQHTGTEVRIAAKGPQAANVLGITDQTALNTTFRRALGIPLR